MTVGSAHTGRTVLRVGIAGGLQMAVTFGMARYAYGLTLPAVRTDLGLSDVALGLIASGTFLGFLLALLLSNPVSARVGPRAATTLGGLSAAIGCVIVSTAPAASVLGVGALLAGSAAGWVWAPYSDIAGQVARPEDRPHLLAWITTGAAAGLLAWDRSLSPSRRGCPGAGCGPQWQCSPSVQLLSTLTGCRTSNRPPARADVARRPCAASSAH